MLRAPLATLAFACGYTLPATTPGTGTGTGSGTTGAAVTEVFVQAPAVVDVLFAIDDSCSMADEQDDLAAAFPAFLDAFVGADADWHLGVVTTDLDATGGAALGWIDAGTADPTAVFASMADVGTEGSGNENGLGAIYVALEDPANAAFLRPDAGLHVVVLSDEDDDTPAALVTPSSFASWLGDVAADRPAVSFNPIVQTDAPAANQNGEDYLEVNAVIGGLVYDIDDVDYGLAMAALGLATSGLDTTFCLAVAPDPATVTVSVVTGGGAVLAFVPGQDYVVAADGCVSFVAFVPSPGDEVHVSYVPAP